MRIDFLTKNGKVMKVIDFKIENHKRIHTTKRGNRMLVWWNDYNVWIAPEFKTWQAKRYKKNQVQLMEICSTPNP